MHEKIKGREQIRCVDNNCVGWQLDLMGGWTDSLIHSADKQSRACVLWDTPPVLGTGAAEMSDRALSPRSLGSNENGKWRTQNDSAGDKVIPGAVTAQGTARSSWPATVLALLSRR